MRRLLPADALGFFAAAFGAALGATAFFTLFFAAGFEGPFFAGAFFGAGFVAAFFAGLFAGAFFAALFFAAFFFGAAFLDAFFFMVFVLGPVGVDFGKLSQERLKQIGAIFCRIRKELNESIARRRSVPGLHKITRDKVA